MSPHGSSYNLHCNTMNHNSHNDNDSHSFTLRTLHTPNANRISTNATELTRRIQTRFARHTHITRTSQRLLLIPLFIQSPSHKYICKYNLRKLEHGKNTHTTLQQFLLPSSMHTLLLSLSHFIHTNTLCLLIQLGFIHILLLIIVTFQCFQPLIQYLHSHTSHLLTRYAVHHICILCRRTKTRRPLLLGVGNDTMTRFQHCFIPLRFATPTHG